MSFLVNPFTAVAGAKVFHKLLTPGGRQELVSGVKSGLENAKSLAHEVRMKGISHVAQQGAQALAPLLHHIPIFPRPLAAPHHPSEDLPVESEQEKAIGRLNDNINSLRDEFSINWPHLPGYNSTVLNDKYEALKEESKDLGKYTYNLRTLFKQHDPKYRAVAEKENEEIRNKYVSMMPKYR